MYYISLLLVNIGIIMIVFSIPGLKESSALCISMGTGFIADVIIYYINKITNCGNVL